MWNKKLTLSSGKWGRVVPVIGLRVEEASRCLFNDSRRTEVSGSRSGPVPPGDAGLMPPLGA